MSERRRTHLRRAGAAALFGLALTSLAVGVRAQETSRNRGAAVEPQRGKKGPILRMAKGFRRMHHFGDVLEGGLESFTFGLTTAGEGRLIVHSVNSNCGCSIGQISQVVDGEPVPYEVGTPLQPGSDLQVEGLIDTFGANGPFSTTLSVRTNTEDRVLTLNLRARVTPALTVEPSVIDVKTLLEGPVTVTIKDNGIGPIRLHVMKIYQEKGQELLESPLSVDLVPIHAEGVVPEDPTRSSHWEARLSLDPNRLVGNQVYEVRLGTDIQTPHQPPPLDGPHPSEAYGAEPEEGPRMYQAWFRVKGEIERGVAINPPLVSFGKVEGDEPLEREVTIRSRDGHVFPEELDLTLERLRPEELPADAFSWEIASRTADRIDLVVRLKRLPDDFKGSFEGVLTLQLDHPTLRTGRVRFTGARR